MSLGRGGGRTGAVVQATLDVQPGRECETATDERGNSGEPGHLVVPRDVTEEAGFESGTLVVLETTPGETRSARETRVRCPVRPSSCRRPRSARCLRRSMSWKAPSRRGHWRANRRLLQRQDRDSPPAHRRAPAGARLRARRPPASRRSHRGGDLRAVHADDGQNARLARGLPARGDRRATSYRATDYDLVSAGLAIGRTHGRIARDSALSAL